MTTSKKSKKENLSWASDISYLKVTSALVLVVSSGLLIFFAINIKQNEKTAKKVTAQTNSISISGETGIPSETGDPHSTSADYVADPEFDSKNPTKKIARKKSEIKKEIVNECTKLIEKLNQANLPDRFVQISFNFYEKSLKDNPVFDDLKYCFFEDPKSKFKIELDVFSSSFGGRGSDQVQIQVSAFEYSSSNKVFETGFQFHLEEAAK